MLDNVHQSIAAHQTFDALPALNPFETPSTRQAVRINPIMNS